MGNSLGKAEDGKDEIFQTLKAKKKEIKKKKKKNFRNSSREHKEDPINK